MNKFYVSFIILFFIFSYFSSANASGNLPGKWIDQQGKNIYIFEKDGTFEYINVDKHKIDVEKIPKELRGKKVPGFDTLYSYDSNEFSVDQLSEYYDKLTGVYEVSDSTCASVNIRTGKVAEIGNLKVYVDTTSCCFSYKFIANKLVLNKVINDSNFFSVFNYCSNRVLYKERVKK